MRVSWAVVGLGNPGPAYRFTRHNAGALCLEHIARQAGTPLERRRLVRLGLATLEGQQVALAVPRTYMNLSGEAVRYLRQRFGLAPGNFLVLYDDMDLPLGRVRIRQRGSAGGHRGMESVLSALGTQEVPRIRIGIGHPPPGVDATTYVLGAFTPPEWKIMSTVLERVRQALLCILARGLQEAMNRYNALPPQEPPL